MAWRKVNRRDELLDWIQPKFFGCIIIERVNIEKRSGAKIIFNGRDGTCTIRGNEAERESAKQLIRGRLDTHSYHIDETYTELDFVQRRHIKGVIGRNGATIRRLKNYLSVVLKVNENRLFIKPNNQNAINYLERFVWILDKNSFPNFESITVQNPDSLSLLRHPPINNHLLEVFQKTKEAEQQRMEREMFKPCVEYNLQLESFNNSLIYNNLTQDELNIDGLERIESKSWYDLSIYTPMPFHKIRYRIFLSNEEEELRFITAEDAGVSGNLFRHMRRGPGYFLKSDEKIARFDLIDPENGNTTRISTSIYNDNHPDEEALNGGNQLDEEDFNQHSEMLDAVLHGITIHQNDEIELPQGYNLMYYCRVTRTSYSFGEDGENILRKSEKRVLIEEDNPVSNPTDRVDLSFENEAINNLLRKNYWQPAQVVDKITNLLESAMTMLANHLA